MKIAFSTNHPNSIIFGGFEIQAWQTYEAVKRAGVDIELLRWHDKAQHFDLLHLFGWSPVWWDVSEHLKVPLVLSVVGGFNEESCAQQVSRVVKSRIRRLLRISDNWSANQSALLGRASKILCLSRVEADRFATEYGMPRSKLVIIPNGVAPTFMSATPNVFYESTGLSGYLLFVGTIMQRKNPLEMLKASKKLGVPIVFIGKPAPAEAHYVHQFRQELANFSGATWIPEIATGSEMLASAYAGARIFCLPSDLETQPLSALEAAAAGVPVILGAGAYSKAECYRGSFVLRQNDCMSIVDAIEQLERDRTLGRIDPAKILSWDSVGAAVVKAYNTL